MTEARRKVLMDNAVARLCHLYQWTPYLSEGGRFEAEMSEALLLAELRSLGCDVYDFEEGWLSDREERP